MQTLEWVAKKRFTTEIRTFTICLSEMGLLNRVARHEWKAEKTRIQHMDHDVFLFQQITAFDTAQL